MLEKVRKKHNLTKIFTPHPPPPPKKQKQCLKQRDNYPTLTYLSTFPKQLWTSNVDNFHLSTQSSWKYSAFYGEPPSPWDACFAQACPLVRLCRPTPAHPPLFVLSFEGTLLEMVPCACPTLYLMVQGAFGDMPLCTLHLYRQTKLCISHGTQYCTGAANGTPFIVKVSIVCLLYSHPFWGSTVCYVYEAHVVRALLRRTTSVLDTPPRRKCRVTEAYATVSAVHFCASISFFIANVLIL